jgi:hypothetical protein
MENILLAVLAATLGKTEGEVKELAETENGQTELLNLHKEKVKGVKDTAFNDGEKKARKEQRSKFEQEIKEAFELDSEKQGVDLVQDLVAAIRTEAKKATDDIKKHPDYLALERESTNKIKQLETEAEEKVKAVEQQYARKDTVATVKAKALAEFEALNPILATDPAKIAKQKALIEREIEAGNYEVVEGAILILDKDGKRQEDAHGNPIKFGDFVKGVADNLGFEFKAATERKSPGDDAPDKDKATGYTGEMPKTAAEYATKMADRAIPLAERLALKEAYEAQPKN